MDKINSGIVKSRPKIAVIFPGQGAQSPGMGRAFYETSPAARAVFDMADGIRPGTSAQCFSGGAEELSVTVNTQPCLFAANLACARAFDEAMAGAGLAGGKGGIAADAAAGFSLGELDALAYSGAIGDAAAFDLVCKRAYLMQECARENPGVMIAVLGLDDAAVGSVCCDFEGVYPVNYNCPGQVVAACPTGLAEDFTAAVKNAGGKCVKLAAGGAFHSPYMDDAAAKFMQILEKSDIASPAIPVYANATAQPYPNAATQPYAGSVADTLGIQMNSPVLWRRTIGNIAADVFADGGGIFIEAGPGKVLAGLVRKIDPLLRVIGVGDADLLARAVGEIAGLTDRI